jgi:hypothetical protein
VEPRARPAATRGFRSCPLADGIAVKTDSRTRTEHKRYYTSEKPKHLKSVVLVCYARRKESCLGKRLS